MVTVFVGIVIAAKHFLEDGRYGGGSQHLSKKILGDIILAQLIVYLNCSHIGISAGNHRGSVLRQAFGENGDCG